MKFPYRRHGLALLAGLLVPAVTLAASVAVVTRPLHKRNLQEDITAYGKVIADPAEVRTISTLEMGRVTRLDVTLGEKVARGQVLLEITPTPQAHNAWMKARHALASAHAKWVQTRDLYRQRLATRADLAAARQQYDNAKADLQSLRAQGASGRMRKVRAPHAAIVTKVQVQPDAVVQAGQPLLELGDSDHLRVRLGLEPEDASRVDTGDGVTLSSVFGDQGRKINAKVNRIQGMVDPTTHLVDALVDLDGKNAQGLTIGSWLVGKVHVRTLDPWSVPRSAVLSDAGGDYLYIVEKGHARRIKVDVLLQTARWTAVASPQLHAGEAVVVSGNYELSDGDAVRETGAHH